MITEKKQMITEKKDAENWQIYLPAGRQVCDHLQIICEYLRVV